MDAQILMQFVEKVGGMTRTIPIENGLAVTSNMVAMVALLKDLIVWSLW